VVYIDRLPDLDAGVVDVVDAQNAALEDLALDAAVYWIA